MCRSCYISGRNEHESVLPPLPHFNSVSEYVCCVYVLVWASARNNNFLITLPRCWCLLPETLTSLPLGIRCIINPRACLTMRLPRVFGGMRTHMHITIVYVFPGVLPPRVQCPVSCAQVCVCLCCCCV